MKKKGGSKVQKYTKQNKNEDQSPFDKLEPVHQAAVTLRLYGMSHDQIALEINRMLKKQKVNKEYPDSTIRKWFATGGICYEAYRYKKDLLTKENNERIKEVDRRLVEAMTDAVVVVHDRIRKNNLQAALETIKIVKDSKKDKNPPVVNNTVVYVPANGR